jgi:E3 ubiquitin-protein ligase SH3RF
LNQHNQNQQSNSSSSTSSSTSSPNIVDQQSNQEQVIRERFQQSEEHVNNTNNNNNNSLPSGKKSSSFGSIMKRWAKMGSSSKSPVTTSSCLSIGSSSEVSQSNRGVNYYCNDNPSFDRSSPTSDDRLEVLQQQHRHHQRDHSLVHPPSTHSSSHQHTNSSVHLRSGSCPARTTAVTSSNPRETFHLPIPINRPLPAIPPPPSNHVKQKQKYRVIANYPPNSDFELELEVGDIVVGHKKRDDGWIKGTSVRTGKTGLFPKSFVEVIPHWHEV